MKYKYVRNLMTSPAINCTTSTTIKEAINLMKENNIGFLPVSKNNIIVGVVTDRDILIRGIGIYKLNTKIDKVMTSGDIHFVNPDTPVNEAAQKMAENKVIRVSGSVAIVWPPNSPPVASSNQVPMALPVMGSEKSH